MINLEALGAIMEIYKKLLILLNGATAPKQLTPCRRKCFSSQPAECINRLRSLQCSRQLIVVCIDPGHHRFVPQ